VATDSHPNRLPTAAGGGGGGKAACRLPPSATPLTPPFPAGYPQKRNFLSFILLYPLSFPDIQNNKLWVEGYGTTSAGTIKLNWRTTVGGNTAALYENLDRLKINIFTWEGPQNVPGYATYTYQATGGSGNNQSKWLPSDKGTNQGTTSGAKSSQPDTVDILWGQGAVVGHAVYQAHPYFKWGLDVNVVNVDVNVNPGSSWLATNNQLPPAWIGMRSQLKINSIKGPMVGNTSRGVRFIEAGFIQHLTFTKQRTNYALRSDPTNPRVAVQEIRRNAPPNNAFRGILEGRTLLDMETMTDRSTIPWLDSESEGAWGGDSIFQGRLGNNVWDRPVPAKTLTTRDVPRSVTPWNAINLTLPGGAGEGTYWPTTVNSKWDFDLYLAVRTTEDVNGSAGIFTQRAATKWRYARTGRWNQPVINFSSGNNGKYSPVTNGTRVNLVRGFDNGTEAVNDLFGRWIFQ